MARLQTLVDKTFRQLGYERKESFTHPTGVFSKFMEGVKKVFTYKLKRTYVNQIKAEIQTFKAARAIAEHPIRPDRRPLYAVYHDLIIDDQIITQLRVAFNTILRAPFQIVDAKGNIKKDAADLFRRPWFNSYLRSDVETEFYGHTLLEFNPDMKNGEFTDLVLLPRDQVRPEFGDILETQNDSTGIPYRNSKDYPWTIELGEVDDLGLLQYCCIPAIRKKYSDTDWSIASEKFGMPFLVVRTQSRQDSELDAKEKMAAGFGANGYAILDDQDEIDLLERSGNANAHLVYFDRIKLADEQIAKIINGQNSTSDQKSYVGAAEVHERILNDFTYARMTRIQYNINFVLIPFLVKNGYPLEGCQFQFKELLEKDNQTNGEQAPSDPKPTTTTPQKKKLNLDKINQTAGLHQQDNCCQQIHNLLSPSPQGRDGVGLRLGFDLTDVFERAIREVYDRKIKLGELHADLWRATADELLKGIDEGTGKTYTNMPYTDPDKEYIAQLRQNAMTFAAFKNHANMTDMFKLLTDQSGKPRSWNDFKAEALKLNAQYNVNWLQAEYNTAVGSARMAYNWHRIKIDFGEDTMLRYETVGDSLVREAHRKLDGITRPMNDAFWKTFCPPNGWNCRCTFTPAIGETQTELPEPPSDEEVPPMFRFNPGEMAELFPPEHPYYTNTTKKQKENIRKAMNKLRFESLEQEGFIIDNQKVDYKRFKHLKNRNALGYDNQSGGYLALHPEHEPDALSKEIDACLILKNEGYRCELLSEQNGNRVDIMLNDKVYDIKQVSNASNPSARIVEHFRFTYKKSDKIILHLTQFISEADLKTAFKNAQRKYPSIIECITIDMNNKIDIKDMTKPI